LLDPTSDASKLVRDAEIITLDIGANDLLGPLYAYAASIKSLADIDNAKVKAILTEMVKNLYGSTGQEIQSGIEKILNNILTANSSAKIYVMGYYNPLPVISALYDVDLNEPTKYLNALIKKAIANVISAHTGASITYVETYNAIAASNTALVMMDIHPTEAGYQIIADEFWKQIEKLTVYYIADAVPSKHHIFVDGVQVPFSAYNVNGNNYVKLRDLSMAFNGTRGQVSISYDKATKAVNIIKGQAYTHVGGELIGIAGMTEAKAYLSASEFNINGEIVNLTAYNINGNNYIKLRDLSEALNFSVEYDASTSTVSIELTER
jgi:lysophospholipase L1-like esterase/glutaredoxin-related protein